MFLQNNIKTHSVNPHNQFTDTDSRNTVSLKLWITIQEFLTYTYGNRWDVSNIITVILF